MDRIHFFHSILDRTQLEVLNGEVEARYHIIEKARRGTTPCNLKDLIPPGQRFVPTASSLTLGSVLSEQGFEELLWRFSGGPAGEWLRNHLDSSLACDLDQAWIRRQYAPGDYPLLHAPHGWHQDGGLGFDFPAYPGGNYPPGALLEMATCWISLTHCGADAPGIELVRTGLDQLVPPFELADLKVQARFGLEEFWRPVFAPGDALGFRGDLLHRTYVDPRMTRARTSIELRFFPAERVPARLKGDRFLVLK